MLNVNVFRNIYSPPQIDLKIYLIKLWFITRVRVDMIKMLEV